MLRALVVGIGLVVAFGPRTALAEDRRLVPEVVGLGVDAAERAIAANGFVPARRSVPGEPAGLVVRQAPGGFAWALPRTTVTIDVRGGAGPAPGPGPSAGPTPPARGTVPDVVGLRQAAAIEALRDYRVTVEVEEAGPEEDGRVLAQDPLAGSSLGAGGAVTLLVGRRGAPAADTALVPSVVGLTQDRASQLLAASDLAPVVVPAASEPSDAGKVLSQDPAGGTVVARRSNVTLTVGREVIGPLNESEVPALVGLLEAEARARLDRAGLLPSVAYVLAPTSAGRVISQEPVAGGRLLRGRPVALRVGVAMITPATVPNVVAMDAVEAERALATQGFLVETGTAVSLAGSAGRVVSQEPPAGTTAIRGTTVRIVVGRAVSQPPGPPPTAASRGALPSYVGTDVAAAQADLAARGLVGVTRSVPGSPEGRVVDQSPAAGATLAPGSVVQLSVSHGASGLPAPILTAPPQGNATPKAYGMTFQWLPVPGAEDYQFEVLVLKGDAWVVADNDVQPGNVKRPHHVKRGKYRWHVRARRDGGRIRGPWSEWREFSIY